MQEKPIMGASTGPPEASGCQRGVFVYEIVCCGGRCVIQEMKATNGNGPAVGTGRNYLIKYRLLESTGETTPGSVGR